MVKKEFRFANGDKVKEKVTGFVGTVTGTCFYLTGCNQYLIFPECKKPHKKPPGHWFDEDRLELIEKEIIKPEKVQGENPGPDMKAPGGKREY